MPVHAATILHYKCHVADHKKTAELMRHGMRIPKRGIVKCHARQKLGVCHLFAGVHILPIFNRCAKV
jgi:hypothetical protein